jgi:hypothetical protein
MKRNINTGEKVINYLASCGKEEVDMLDLVEAVVPGCHEGEEMDEAFGSILPVLTNLESGGLVRLSTEAIPSTGFVPRLISILPKMKNAADRLMQDKSAGGQTGGSPNGQPKTGGKPAAEGGVKSAGGRERKADAISSRFHAFVDLFEKKRKLVRIKGEWNRLVSSMIYHDIEEETGFQACVKAFVNGLIWQRRLEQIGPGNMPADKQEKEEPRLQPGLLSKIDEIIRADEEKNGTLKAGRKGRRAAVEADAPLVRLDRGEIKDFMHCVHNMREEIQPGRLWRDAVSRFIAEQLEQRPVYEACMESFRAGIIWQMNRKKLES